ncbi:MAG: UDP-N-acetylmuramoyl-L-alanine--D-glutamate ligase [bacterium]|nr:UDP-N-acetylmuramoyl-L-alanine--D-glutamate ligase [bacterium]
MNEYKQYFKGKKITLLGLGLLGRGVGDAAFLAQQGAELIVTDLKTKKELAQSLSKLKKYKNIIYVLGRHQKEDFKNRDMIIKSAGVTLDSPYIAEARKNKIPVTMSTALFVKLLPKGVTVIGVTGTRGKSTVAHLIYQMLLKAGKRVFLGGNVRGISTLALLPKIKRGDFVVLELDSWQLQGFGDEKISPHISVFTNFMMDHLNYYKGSVKKYFSDKSHIFAHQKKGDYLVAPKDITRYIERKYIRTKIKSKIITPKPIPKIWNLRVIGTHNRENASCVVAVGNILNIKPEDIKKILTLFKGVPGRLQFLHSVRDVKIYNDTTATTPDATVAALKALASTKKNIILIMGGADKKLDMSRLVKEIPKYCKVVVLLPGTGTSKLISNFQFPISKQFLIFNATNLKKAIKKGMSVAEKGDVLLFSPAFASFGLFKNEFDRGEQFIKIIRSL